MDDPQNLGETLSTTPEVHAAADGFMEAADWIVLQLTGQERGNACTAGYKAIWNKTGLLSLQRLLSSLRPTCSENLWRRSFHGHLPIGSARAGSLTAEMAAPIGLRPGIAVAIGNVDAHVAVPASTVTGAGVQW